MLPLGFCVGVSIADSETPLRLQLPLQCTVGEDCHIQNYFDHDPGSGFSDFTCGTLGYDGHKGTDFRLPSLSEMKRGVSVVAAADGRVRSIRDSMEDISVNQPGVRARIEGHEAGNGVAIVHAGGWETQYSHMRRGSILVKPGQQVKAGDRLGLVGLSGKTEFPHLHLSVRHNGRPVDPFVGLRRDIECGPGDRPLWSKQVFKTLRYRPTGLLQSGFTSNKPEIRLVEAGAYRQSHFPTSVPSLIFWVEVFGIQQGDREWLAILKPDGSPLVEKRGRAKKSKARWFSYAGKKRRSEPWAKGTYIGIYRLRRERQGRLQEILNHSVELEVH